MDITTLRRALARLDPRSLACRAFACPACGPSLLVRLAREETAVRCLRCRASAVSLSLIASIRRFGLVRPGRMVHETSVRGPLHVFLARSRVRLSAAEYFEGVPSGHSVQGIPCQDLQDLAMPDASLDLLTASEVFEHVADDRRALAEVRRVLRPGGALAMTVPFDPRHATRERACPGPDGVRFLAPPAYHGDRLRGESAVLVFRDYGRDLPRRIRDAGFRRVSIDLRWRRAWFGFGRPVVVAWR